MYDRRVVRGNTFAALVIPVSKYHRILLAIIVPDHSTHQAFFVTDMQPGPLSVEKQKKAAAARRNRLQQMKVSHISQIDLQMLTKTDV